MIFMQICHFITGVRVMVQLGKFIDSFKCSKSGWRVLKRFASKCGGEEGSDCKDAVIITIDNVKAAYEKIKDKIVYTPCPESQLGSIYDMKIYMKCEFLQFTGSFKDRGALNALLNVDDKGKKNGVMSASMGNHAEALSYHGCQLKVPVTLFMPTTCAIMKVHQCTKFGAKVIVEGETMLESRSKAMKMAKEKGMKYIHRFDNPDVIAGHGTMALEILEQVPNVDAVIVPVGGGGLIAGVAATIKALKPECLVYGIESEKCPSLNAALEKGKPVRIESQKTVADCLAVRIVGCNAFTTLKPLLDKHIVISDEWIVRSVLLMIEQQKYVVEGSGACAMAAIIADLVPELKKKTVVPILTGGNMDTTVLGRCLERGLAASGRLVKFKVTVTDRPGGGAELCRMIANIGVSIKDMIQERAWVKGDIFSVRIKLIAETRDEEHKKELVKLIQTKYLDWEFGDAHQVSEAVEKLK